MSETDVAGAAPAPALQPEPAPPAPEPAPADPVRAFAVLTLPRGPLIGGQIVAGDGADIGALIAAGGAREATAPEIDRAAPFYFPNSRRRWSRLTMSTTVLPRGRQQKLRLAWESTFATNPGTGFNELNPYTTAFNRSRALEADDVLGGGFANLVDGRPAAPTIEDATGKINVPLDLAQIGWWLAAALGRVSATGTTTKTHAFVSGNTSIPSLCLEREMVAAAQYEGMLGGVIKSMKFPIGAGKGYGAVDMDLIASRILEPYTTTAAGTPSTADTPPSNRVPKSVGILKIAGTQVGQVISGDMTLTNGITLDRYIGDAAYPSTAVLESQDVAVSLSARYNTDALRAYGALGSGILPSVQEVDFVYSLGASLSLTLSCMNCRFEPVDLDVQNGKTITVAMKGRGEVGASGPMLQATLVNAHASY